MVKKSHFYLLSNILLRVISIVFFPSIAFSHGLNVRYELPIPLYMYIITSVFIIVVTIFFSKYFINKYIKSSKEISERHSAEMRQVNSC